MDLDIGALSTGVSRGGCAFGTPDGLGQVVPPRQRPASVGEDSSVAVKDMPWVALGVPVLHSWVCKNGRQVGDLGEQERAELGHHGGTYGPTHAGNGRWGGEAAASEGMGDAVHVVLVRLVERPDAPLLLGREMDEQHEKQVQAAIPAGAGQSDMVCDGVEELAVDELSREQDAGQQIGVDPWGGGGPATVDVLRVVHWNLTMGSL